MCNQIVLKRLTDEKYLSSADICSKTIFPDCKYVFLPYDFFKIVRFNSEKDAIEAYADYCKYHNVEDVQMIYIISATK